MRFTKMHGLGNDYVYVNCFEETVENPGQIAKIISDRHFGIGSDGLILICPSETADVRMQMFNADGSRAQMCGNGIRCLAKYVYEHELAPKGPPLNIPGQPPFPASMKVETDRGILTVGLITDRDNLVTSVCVNMGEPILSPEEIPVKVEGETVVNYAVDILDQRLEMTCVSMGNPHAVFFCHDATSVNMEQTGPVIENHKLFPERTNVHFAQIDGPNEITMRTWERGSGITLACGTGAAAVCVAGVLTDQSQRSCTIHLPGGDLELNWAQKDNCVYMTGPAVEVFTGEWAD